MVLGKLTISGEGVEYNLRSYTLQSDSVIGWTMIEDLVHRYTAKLLAVGQGQQTRIWKRKKLSRTFFLKNST